jgi:hypothetical protein
MPHLRRSLNSDFAMQTASCAVEARSRRPCCRSLIDVAFVDMRAEGWSLVAAGPAVSSLSALAVSAFVTAGGCGTAPVQPSKPTAYEGCYATATAPEGGCPSDLACKNPVLLDAEGLGGMCTRACGQASDCPAHARMRCERFVYGQFCTIGCTDDAHCPAGTICVERSRVDGTPVHFCRPRS